MIDYYCEMHGCKFTPLVSSIFVRTRRCSYKCAPVYHKIITATLSFHTSHSLTRRSRGRTSPWSTCRSSASTTSPTTPPTTPTSSAPPGESPHQSSTTCQSAAPASWGALRDLIGVCGGNGARLLVRGLAKRPGRARLNRLSNSTLEFHQTTYHKPYAIVN